MPRVAVSIAILAACAFACTGGGVRGFAAEEDGSPAAANPRFTGTPLLRTWVAQDYGAEPENECFAQDPRTGFIYAGNRGGVLEFDGARWRLIRVHPTEAVRTLVHDRRGRLWVTTGESVWRLEPDARGELQAVQQTARLPGGFSFTIMGGVARAEGVYFRDNARLALFPDDDGPPRMWRLAGGPVVVGAMWEMDGYLNFQAGNETLRLRDGEIERLPSYAGYVFDLRARPEGGHDVAVQGGFSWWRDFAHVQTWHAFKGDTARCALFLRDGRVAFGMNRNGVLLFDREGRLLQRIDRARGLPANAVRALLEDRDGGLWVATPYGLARVEIDSPYALHGAAQKLEGTNAAFAEQAGSLYLGGTEGLWHRQPGGEFRPVAGGELEVRDLTPLGGNLYVQSRKFRVLTAGQENARELENRNYYGLVPLTRAPGWFVHGCNEGIRWARFEGERWATAGPLAATNRPTRVWFEVPAGIVWASGGSTVYRIDFRDGPAANAPTKRIPTELPSAGLRLFSIDGQVIALGGGGFHRYDEATGRFVPHPFIHGLGEAGNQDVRLAHLSADGTLWLLRGEPSCEIWRARRTGAAGRWQAEKLPGPVLRHLEPTGLFHELATRTLWIATHGAVVSRDLGWQPTRETAPPAAIVHRVETPTGEVLFNESASTVAKQLVLKPAQTAVRIAFAAPTFAADHTGVPRVQYCTRLEGLESDWTGWSAEIQRDFTNLAWRSYTFHVQARGADGREGPVATFVFAIPAPWWATNWAFGGYASAAMLAIMGVFRLRTRALRRRNARLETLIAERTREAHAAKLAAEAANRAKGAFLANMSHELRTPLNAILGFAQILRRAPDLPAPHRDRLGIIARNGDHLLALINEVLDLSKIEAGKLAVTSAPFPLARLLAVTADTFAQRARDKGLEFRGTIAPDLPAHVEGDEAKLRQVLFNLLGNALKFTERGSVQLNVAKGSAPTSEDAAAGRLRTSIRFEVCDTGVGIAPEDRERIFEPFHQGRRNPLGTHGTGLGLAISQHIVELMGGTIRVESQPGRGSRFRFELALPAASEPAPQTTASRTINGYLGARRRLLVVDDEPANRDVLRGLLEPLGFAIEECGDGQTAVSLCQQRPVDAVLLDLRMPGIDGLTTARRLRALPGGKAPAIIAVSASVFEEDRHTAIEAGCDDFVPKPFDEDRLLATLSGCLQLTWTSAEPESASRAPVPVAARPPLPPDEAESLLDLARRGDIRNFRERLKFVAARHPACAPTIEHLDQLAAGFQLGALRHELGRDLQRESASP